MRALSTIRLLATAACVAILSVASSAQADDSSGKTNVASSLLPLEVRSVAAQNDDTLMGSVEDRINSPEAAQDNSEATDVLGAGLVDDFMNENGDINLPLGLTVFDAMGTTSIGVGGSF
jgi:hypothetical protein